MKCLKFFNFIKETLNSLRNCFNEDNSLLIQPKNMDSTSQVMIQNTFKRGKALIVNFNNYELDDPYRKQKIADSQFDLTTLEETFSKFKFNYVISENPTFGELKALLDEISKNLSEYDCFACIILSSGYDHFITTLDKPFSLDMLYEPFTRYESIRMIPKLFFFQTRRNKQFISKAENDQFIRINENSRSFVMFNMFRFYSILYGSSNTSSKNGSFTSKSKRYLSEAINNRIASVVISELCGFTKKETLKTKSFLNTINKVIETLNENSTYNGQIQYVTTKSNGLKNDFLFVVNESGSPSECKIN